MGSRASPRRVLAIATVVAAHAGVLLVLLEETRTRIERGEAQPRPLFVMLLGPRERRPPAPPMRAAARPPESHLAPPAPPESEVRSSVTPAAPGRSIDWEAEASVSAARQIEADEQRARQERALTPKQSPMFAARRRRPGFHWDYARTHRVEPMPGLIPGLGTVIHLSDQCAIALFLIIPVGGGCALGKPPARGDLFEHMRDRVDDDELR